MRIGILGAGQLGRMLALDGFRLGHDFSLYDPNGKASAGVGTIYNDPDGLVLTSFSARSTPLPMSSSTFRWNWSTE